MNRKQPPSNHHSSSFYLSISFKFLEKAQEDEQKSGNGQENPEDGKTKKSQEEKIEAEKTTKKDGRDDEGASVVFGLISLKKQ
jgi:hypothetical protein